MIWQQKIWQKSFKTPSKWLEDGRWNSFKLKIHHLRNEFVPKQLKVMSSWRIAYLIIKLCMKLFAEKVFCTGSSYPQSKKLVRKRLVTHTPNFETKLRQRCVKRRDTSKGGLPLISKSALKYSGHKFCNYNRIISSRKVPYLNLHQFLQHNLREPRVTPCV